MTYVRPNFKTKKALREAVASGAGVEVFEPGPWRCEQYGTVSIEGPWSPAPHTWRARAEVYDGIVVKVR